MKSKVLFVKALALVFVLMSTAGLNAENIILEKGKDNKIEVTGNTYQKLSVINTIANIKLLKNKIDAGDFLRIAMASYSKNMEYGAPELLVNRKLIEIPIGAELKLTVVNSDFIDYDLKELNLDFPIYPAQPPQSKSEDTHEFIIDQSNYQLNTFGEKDLAWVDVLGLMRGIRIARLNIAPFKYNPVSQVLRVYTKIEVEVLFEGANVETTKQMRQWNNNPFFSGLNQSLLNAKPQSSRENFMRYPIKYVIVSDPMFKAQLQPFIEWKTKKGFTVVEAYTDDPDVGNSTGSIKAYLQGLYNMGTTEDPAPTFVLFVGDVEQIPAWEDGNGETDRLYCEYTGDLFPEIYYGRMSAQNAAHLQPQIDKTLQYEKYSMPDPTYLDEVVMIAGVDGSHGNDWGNGQINYGTINYFNEDHNIFSHTYLYPESGNSSAQIIQDISDGVTFANYTAHCSPDGWADPSFSISDIATLQNQDMYGLLVGNCCSSSEFAQTECFGEAIVRAENKGAVAYNGASNSSYWDEDYYYGVGVGTISENPPPYEQTSLGSYDRAFHDHGEEMGDWYVSANEMNFAGNLAVTEGSPSSANYYWDIYNTSGDPSIMVYFSNPPAMAVSFEPLLPMGTTPFEITTEPFAYVAISMDGILNTAVLADANGNAILDIEPFTVPGTADIVITKQNKQPYIGTVIVANPAGPYLMLESYAVVDTFGIGNGNNNADFGEEVTLNVELENLGNSDASNARATISTNDTMITLMDDFQEWGNIPAHSFATEYSAYRFKVKENAPDQHIVSFAMQMEDDGDETWAAEINVTLNAPVLFVQNMIIDDSEFGNNNGRLDPGETADIKVSNKNTGHCIAENTIAEIETACHYLTLESTVDTLGDLGMFGAVNAVYRVHVEPDAPNGVVLAHFDYTLRSGFFIEEHLFTQKIGLLYEDFETGVD
jgi:peptidase C25-like protein